MDDIVTELAENGAIPEIIVVGINSNLNRMQEYLPEKVFNQLTKEEHE